MAFSLSDKVGSALESQSFNEMAVQSFYLGFEVWAKNSGYKHSGRWAHLMAKERKDSARNIIKYLLVAGEAPDIPSGDNASTEFASLQDAFEKALALEEKENGNVANVQNILIRDGDWNTEDFWRRYIKRENKSLKCLTKILNLFSATDDPIEIDDKVKRFIE